MYNYAELPDLNFVRIEYLRATAPFGRKYASFERFAQCADNHVGYADQCLRLPSAASQ